MGKVVTYMIMDIDDTIIKTKKFQLQYLKDKYDLKKENYNKLYQVLHTDFEPYIIFHDEEGDKELRKQVIKDLRKFDTVKYVLNKYSWSLRSLEKTKVYTKVKSEIYNPVAGEKIIDYSPDVIEFISSNPITKYKRKFLELLAEDTVQGKPVHVRFKQLSTCERVTHTIQKVYDLMRDGWSVKLVFVDNHPAPVCAIQEIVDNNTHIFRKDNYVIIRAIRVKT